MKSRRNVLERAGAALATASLCGCLKSGGGSTATDDPVTAPSSGGSTAAPTATDSAQSPTATAAADTSVETTVDSASHFSTGDGSFAAWLPTPADAGVFTRDRYLFLHVTPATLLDNGDSLSDALARRAQFDSVVPGIDDSAEITSATRVFGGWITVETPFDRERVEDVYLDRGFEGGATYHGFDVLSNGEAATVALGDDVIVFTSDTMVRGDGDGRPPVEAVVDAGTGTAKRYRDADTDCGRLLDALGQHHATLGLSHERGANFDDAVATGVAYRFGAEQTRARAVVVFASGAVHESAVASWAGAAEMFHGREVTTVTDGRVVVADALVPTTDITKLPTTLPTPDEVTAAPTSSE